MVVTFWLSADVFLLRLNKLTVSGSAEQNEKTIRRRILCIDGGGILGAFPAAFLASLEDHIDEPIGSYFDLIAGTSTGGIIATGLAMGLSASEILEFYERDGPKIFAAEGSRVENWIKNKARIFRQLVVSKYSSDRLRDALENALGEKRIGDAKTRLILPAWNPEAQRVYIYKTAHHPRLAVDYKIAAVDAVMATASAPTYFRQHISDEDVGLIDGGVWANNPIAVAVVEAISTLGWKSDEIDVLSLGCLDEIYTIPENAGLSTLNVKLIKLFMDGQKHGAMGMAKLLTGHDHEREAIHRIDHTVSAGRFSLDDTSKIRKLKGIGYSYARERLPKMKQVFLTEPAEKFVPFHSLTTEPDK